MLAFRPRAQIVAEVNDLMAKADPNSAEGPEGKVINLLLEVLLDIRDGILGLMTGRS